MLCYPPADRTEGVLPEDYEDLEDAKRIFETRATAAHAGA